MGTITHVAVCCVTKVHGHALVQGGLATFPWAQVVPIVAALIAAVGVAATLYINAARARRETLATLYGDALGAVAAYLEGPYRILKKDGTHQTRLAITSKLSDVSTSIDHHRALMRLHAPPMVADAYDHFVSTARGEAGKQMSAAWDVAPVTTDAGVNLGTALPRVESDKAQRIVLEMMQAQLRYRWYSAQTRDRRRLAEFEVVEVVRQAELNKAGRALAPSITPPPAP